MERPQSISKYIHAQWNPSLKNVPNSNVYTTCFIWNFYYYADIMFDDHASNLCRQYGDSHDMVTCKSKIVQYDQYGRGFSELEAWQMLNGSKDIFESCLNFTYLSIVTLSLQQWDIVRHRFFYIPQWPHGARWGGRLSRFLTKFWQI